MKYRILLMALAMLALNFTFVNAQNENELRGEITFSTCPESVSSGDDYNDDGTEIMHSSNSLAGSDMNVIISLHPLTFTPKLELTKDAYISQSEQTFLPNVLPIVIGSKVHFLNEDEFFHNVQSYTPNARFSIGRRAPGISYSIKIEKLGIIQLSCDIHAHMNAKILSFDTPYFTRIKEDGTYSITNLPDGSYEVRVYHPSCGELTDKISIKGSKVFDYNYNLSLKS